MELTPEQQQIALDLAVAGKTINQICEQLGISRHQMFYFREGNTTFDGTLARALSEGIEAQTDRLATIYEEDHMKDPQKARGVSDNIKWLASKRKVHRYGDRSVLELEQRIDLNGALLEARKRASLPACDQDALEDSQVAEYWEVGEGEPNGSEPLDSAQDDDGVDIFS